MGSRFMARMPVWSSSSSPRVQTAGATLFQKNGPSDISVGIPGRPEVEPTAVEVHGDLESLGIAVAAGALLDRGDLRVQPLGRGVGDAVLEVREHVGQVPRDRLGRLDDRRQLAVRGPEVPASPESLGPGLAGEMPQLAQRLLQCPRASGLELRALELVEALA